MIRIAVLASGRGSNFAALRDACAAGRIDGQMVGLFSDKPACGAVALAAAAGLPHWAQAPSGFENRVAFDHALFDAMTAVQPDLIVCAGYMRIIGATAVARFTGRMLNIHPSLLPRHPGLHTHARALAAGDAEHGTTVHVVTPELDAGPALAQARVPVRPGDSAADLAARVLQREHPLLVACVAEVASGRLQLSPVPAWCGQPLRAPLSLRADNTLGLEP